MRTYISKHKINQFYSNHKAHRWHTGVEDATSSKNNMTTINLHCVKTCRANKSVSNPAKSFTCDRKLLTKVNRNLSHIKSQYTSRDVRNSNCSLISYDMPLLTTVFRGTVLKLDDLLPEDTALLKRLLHSICQTSVLQCGHANARIWLTQRCSPQSY